MSTHGLSSRTVTLAGRSSDKPLTPLRTPRVAVLLIDAAILICFAVLIFSWRFPIFSNALYLPSDTSSFGTVESGSLVQRQFVMRNVHPWKIKVLSVEGSCGCTRSFLGKTAPFDLAPFDSVVVNATLDTSEKKGHIKQEISVLTSDNPKGTKVYMEGTVR